MAFRLSLTLAGSNSVSSARNGDAPVMIIALNRMIVKNRISLPSLRI
jgi:hypothetical protein